MTIICWDGKTLAADKRAVCQGLSRTVTKIRRFGNLLVGVSGDTEAMGQAMQWVSNGRKPEDYPAYLKDKDCKATMMIIDADRVLIYGESPIPTHYEDKKTATGSGRDYALAAMLCGKTAREAVEIACLFETGCGNGIDELEV